MIALIFISASNTNKQSPGVSFGAFDAAQGSWVYVESACVNRFLAFDAESIYSLVDTSKCSVHESKALVAPPGYVKGHLLHLQCIDA